MTPEELEQSKREFYALSGLPAYVLETTEKGKPTTRSKPFIYLPSGESE
jgi:hypothetical protein